MTLGHDTLPRLTLPVLPGRTEIGLPHENPEAADADEAHANTRTSTANSIGARVELTNLSTIIEIPLSLATTNGRNDALPDKLREQRPAGTTPKSREHGRVG